MAIIFGDSYQNNSPKPVDNKYGRFVSGAFRAYTNVAEANSTISSAYRYKGLTVLIGDGTNDAEYWYKGGVTDQSLVLKSASPGGSDYTFEGFGVAANKTAAENKVALQAALDYISDNNGGVIHMTDKYPMNGPINAPCNVKIVGTAWSDFKGPGTQDGGITARPEHTDTPDIPALASFEITDTVNSIFVLSAVTGFTLSGVGFNYPNQPIGTTTPSSSLIHYPPTIYGGTYVIEITLEKLWFVGAWSMIEFTDTCADLFIDKVYGYPLSGRGISIKNCVDISRMRDCLFSPGMGNSFRTFPTTGQVFTSHSVEVALFVMNSSLAFIEWENTDEFMMSGCFAFSYPTFIKVTNSYGTIVQCPADIGRVGLDLNCGQPTKAINVYGFSCIGSAGDDPATRDMVVIRGDGYYNFYGISPKLGITAYAGLQNGTPVNNSVIKILAGGTPYVSVWGIKGGVLGGYYINDIQNFNANAVLDIHSVDLIKVANSYIDNSLPIVTFEAEMIGTNGTNFNSYTPEIGTAVTSLTPFVLNGTGGLVSGTSSGSALKITSAIPINRRITIVIKSLTAGTTNYVGIRMTENADTSVYTLVAIANSGGGIGSHNIQTIGGTPYVNNASASISFPLTLTAILINGVITTTANSADLLSWPQVPTEEVNTFYITAQNAVIERILMEDIEFYENANGINEQIHTTGATALIANGQKDLWFKVNPQTPLSNLSIKLPSKPYDGQTVDITFGNNIRFGTVVTNLTIVPNIGQSLKQPVPDLKGVSGVTLTYRYEASTSSWTKLGTPIEIGDVVESSTNFFLANMNGTSGTNFNSYTPEIGTATATLGAALLNGTGAVQFNSSGSGTVININGTIPANRRVTIVINSLPSGGGGVTVISARNSDQSQYTLSSIANVNNTTGAHNIQDHNGVLVNHPSIPISFPLTYVVTMIDGLLTSTVNGDVLSVSPAQAIQVITIISIGGLIDSIFVESVFTTVTGFITNKNIEVTTADDGIILKSTDGTRYLLTVANGGSVTITNVALAGVFFMDNFTGSSGAYSGHTPDKGTATNPTTGGLVAITLDGSGHGVFGSGGASQLIPSGTLPTDIMVTCVINSLAVGQSAFIVLFNGGSPANTLYASVFNSDGTNYSHGIVSSISGVIVVTNSLVLTFPITFVARRVGLVVTTSINGADVLNYTHTGTGPVCQIISTGTALYDSIKVEPV